MLQLNALTPFYICFESDKHKHFLEYISLGHIRNNSEDIQFLS